jgi:D-amino peptidase
VAAHYGVPIILVSGDEVTAREAELVAPDAEKVVVKRSLGRFAAAHLHPDRACELLREGARRAVTNRARMRPPLLKEPIELDVTFLVADMAEWACRVRGVELIAPRTVRISAADPLDIYRQFTAMVILARTIADG